MQYYRTSLSRYKPMRLLPFVISAVLLAGCSTIHSSVHAVAELPNRIVYKLPTRQGNVIEQKQLDQLQVGMTRDQVKFLMGTPIATSPFRTEQWDYFGYYKSPRGEISTRTVKLYFDEDKLARMDGVQIAAADAGKDKALDTPDVSTLDKDKKKESVEESRAASEAGKPSGVAIPTPGGAVP